MITIVSLQRTADALLDLGALFGCDPAEVRSWEHLSQVTFESRKFPTHIACAWTLDQLKPIAESLTPGFSCKLYLYDPLDPEVDSETPVLEISKETTNSDLDHFCQKSDGYDHVQLIMRFNKSELLKERDITARNCQISAILFPETLHRIFNTSESGDQTLTVLQVLISLEKGLWPVNVVNKAVILVLGQDVFIDGPYLALVGGKYLPDWKKVEPTESPDFGRLRAIYKFARDCVIWDNRWLDHLTPAHFELVKCQPENGAILAALRHLQLSLIIHFTANRTRTNGDGYQAIYSDSRNTFPIDLRSPAQPPFIENQIMEHWDAVYDVFEWAYGNKWVVQRVPFIQTVVAQELSSRSNEDQYNALIMAAPSTLTNIERRWDHIVEQKLEVYTTEERELEEFVTEQINVFSNQVSEIIKSLSDTMLAAIAALLGSFIAAGFGKDEFDPLIFTIGMLVYSLYVMIFPLLYNMTNQWTRYKSLEENLDTSLKRYQLQLSQDRMEQIVGDRLVISQKRFRLWFFGTVIIYLVAITLGIATAILIPLYITPTTTP